MPDIPLDNLSDRDLLVLVVKNVNELQGQFALLHTPLNCPGILEVRTEMKKHAAFINWLRGGFKVAGIIGAIVFTSIGFLINWLITKGK